MSIRSSENEGAFYGINHVSAFINGSLGVIFTNNSAGDEGGG